LNSVIYSGKSLSPKITRPINELLIALKSKLLETAHEKLSRSFAGQSLNTFVNYYLDEHDGMIVSEHVDQSLLTALTAAVDLQQADSKTLPGFEFVPSGQSSFVPLVPRQVNDIVVMCGAQAGLLKPDDETWPVIRHRVTNVADVAGKNRFTMVFKIH
jgi:hypothetical protein